MMKKKYGFAGLMLAGLFIFGLTPELRADSNRGRGLVPFSAEEIQHVEQNHHWIVDVKPNKTGLARIQEHLKKHGKAPLKVSAALTHEEEFVTHKGHPGPFFGASLGSATLPSSVDNSALPSYPPIGDQGDLGSCVAWASTYYQATQEIGLLNGLNNKSSQEGVLSPKWTYNMINGGVDNGAQILDGYNLLSQNGATNIVSFPYDENYLAWDLNSQDWVTAISNRMKPANLVAGVGGDNAQNLQVIKQLLNNGHVLTFGTFIDSWVFTKVKANPSNPNSPAVGQMAASWMNGEVGGHLITIVGYNDNVWIDVNGNGQVDSGELGAFLISNSWGTGWGNDGFVWISYDAFLSTSAVPNGPSQNRVPAAIGSNNYLISSLPKAASYSPSLIAQFTVNQSTRDLLSIGAGVSDTSSTTPSQTFISGAIVNQGGPYEFNGTVSNSAGPGTFTLDLTDLVSTDTDLRYYLLLSNDSSSVSTTLSSYTIIDKVHNNQVSYAGTPITFDKKELSPYIEYNFGGTTPQAPSPLSVSITTPTANSTVDGSFQVIASASDSASITSVQLMVDSTVVSTDTSSPYQFTVDTTNLSDGTHQLTVVATDVNNVQATNSININVQNGVIPTAINVNAGGNAVTYQGTTWVQDEDFTTPSYTNTARFRFNNPIYKTERSGNFSYNFAVTNGSYDVTLNFCEIDFKRVGQRVFNVVINGDEVLTNLDLIQVSGFCTPYNPSFPVTVTSGAINIQFIPVTNSATVSGIQIAPGS